MGLSTGGCTAQRSYRDGSRSLTSEATPARRFSTCPRTIASGRNRTQLGVNKMPPSPSMQRTPKSGRAREEMVSAVNKVIKFNFINSSLISVIVESTLQPPSKPQVSRCPTYRPEKIDSSTSSQNTILSPSKDLAVSWASLQSKLSDPQIRATSSLARGPCLSASSPMCRSR